eukprot:scaffold3793_cov397-Prasinococcus_capsulatus_cf.AAC.6
MLSNALGLRICDTGLAVWGTDMPCNPISTLWPVSQSSWSLWSLSGWGHRASRKALVAHSSRMRPITIATSVWKLRVGVRP